MVLNYNFNDSVESNIFIKINEFNDVTDYYKECHYKRVSHCGTASYYDKRRERVNFLVFSLTLARSVWFRYTRHPVNTRLKLCDVRPTAKRPFYT